MFDSFKSLKGELTTYGIGLLQAKAFRILKQQTTEALKPDDISTVDWALLGLLFDEEAGMRMSDIAQELGVEAPFVTQTVENLLQKQFIEKSSLAGDARVKIIRITKKGSEIVPIIEARLRTHMRHLLKGASIRGIIGYRSILKTIIDNAQSED